MSMVRKAQIYGMTGTLVSCTLLFLFLYLVIIPVITNEDKSKEEGIMVSFGYSDEGSGVNGPGEPVASHEEVPQPVKQTYTPPTPEPVKTTVKSKPVQNDYVTQKENNAVAVAAAEQKRKEKQQRDAIEKQRLEDARVAAEQKRKEQQAADKANSTIGGLFGKGGGTGYGGGSGSGTTTGNTQQGNPAGRGSVGGNSWSLNGRTLDGRLIQPGYDKDVEGKVTVSIRVDESGNVLSATISSPTTISDSSIREAALQAARNTRFSSGKGVAAGTITYNFRLR